MDNTTNSSIPWNKGRPSVNYIAGDEYRIFMRVMIVVTIVVALSGIVCNIFNVRTFYILGLKDGIAVSLFGLTISDMCYLFSCVGIRIMSTFVALEEDGTLVLPVHPSVVSVCISYVTTATSHIGMFVVTFLAVARCLCVSMPLHFKTMFTKTKCIAFYVSFVIISIAIEIPVAANTGVRRLIDPIKNETRIYVRFTDDREKIKAKTWLVFDLILPIVFEVTLIVCVFIMLHKLREAASFRNVQSQNVDSADKETKLSPRDRRIVIQVLLISVIYIIANIPRIFNSLYIQFEPDFDLGGKYQNFYYMMIDIRLLSECINATLNFFVYYKFNSAFRAACLKSKLGISRGISSYTSQTTEN